MAEIMRVYYLTAEEFALDNLKKKRIKISRLSDLNDPFELAVDLPKREDRNAFNKLKAQLNSKRGVICFSKAWENPVLWSHYADKHKGICLGFDVPDDMLVEINYTRKRLVVDIEKLLDRNALNQTTIKILTTKFEDWRYEDEVRFLVNLNERDKDKDTEFFYKNFGEDVLLREIIIGPRCKTGRSRRKPYIAGCKPKVEIIKSRLAFRSFKVVRNLASK